VFYIRRKTLYGGLLQDMVPGPAQGGIELIDIIFAFSNVKLVRELVQDNIRQLEEMNSISKGQNEGIKQMIMAKQKVLYDNLSEVEKTLESVIDVNIKPQAPVPIAGNVQLNTDQSKALVGAIVFAINHMVKFIPGANMGGSGLPESIV
jgi:hypothetical protein